MDDQNKKLEQNQNSEQNTPQTPPVVPPPTTTPTLPSENVNPSSSLPEENTQAPSMSVATGAPSSQNPSNPQTFNMENTEKKNGGLVLVLVILTLLIIILGALYYIIIKQSYQSNTDISPVTPPVQEVTPTTAPTVTPTDDQILNENMSDPTKDIDSLDKDAQNL